MSYLKSMGTGFVWICTFLAAITFIPGLPPNIEITPYSIKPAAAINKERNNRLNGAEKLFEGSIEGPEAFDSYDGVLYTSLLDGTVSKLVGKKLVEVVKFGEHCDGVWEEHKCGRPLGLKFDKNGNLYVADSYYGIFKVNVTTGKYEKIIDIFEPIEEKPPKLPNGIDVATNGDLYWTDSSTDFVLSDGVFSLLANPSGRLIHYNAATKKNVVLLKNLGFPNGIKLSSDESFVIVAETMFSRIIKYYIKGPKAGKSEFLIESLPGAPDNIHGDGHGNFFISLVNTFDEEHPMLTQTLAPQSNLRTMILRILSLTQAPFKLLEEAYPNYYSKRISHFIGHFKSLDGLNPQGATVLRIDGNGKVLDILDNNDENLSGVSSAFIFDEYLYLGSPWKNYVARVPLKKVLPGFKVAEKVTPDVGKNEKVKSTSSAPKPTEKIISKPTIVETKPTPAETKKVPPKQAEKQTNQKFEAKVEGSVEKPVPVEDIKKQNIKPVTKKTESKPKRKQTVKDEM